jgi:hypothetical protein
VNVRGCVGVVISNHDVVDKVLLLIRMAYERLINVVPIWSWQNVLENVSLQCMLRFIEALTV